MIFLKLLLLIPISAIGYFFGSIALAVEHSNLAFCLGFLFGALGAFFTFVLIYENSANPDNSPSLAGRIAPLAFLCWMLNRKD